MTSIDAALIERLAALDVGQVSDVLDEAGYPNQVLSATLGVRTGPARFAGKAACVSGAPLVRTEHPARPSFALDDDVPADCVLLVETGGFSAGAIVGGFVAQTLMSAKCRGLIVDGAMRDVDEIAALGFPVVARTITPVNGYRRWAATRRQEPIRLPGQAGPDVMVSPGDAVLSDADGIVVIPARIAEQIIADTEQLAAIERRIGEALRSGGKRSDAFRANPRFRHVRPAS